MLPEIIEAIRNSSQTNTNTMKPNTKSKEEKEEKKEMKGKKPSKMVDKKFKK